MTQQLSPATTETTRQAVGALIDAATRFYNRGWMMGTSGNLSIRVSSGTEPVQMVITASGKDKGRLTETDFLLVDGTGQLLDSPVLQPALGAKSSAETLLHSQLYQMDPEIGAVYHVHTHTAALLSQYGQEKSGRIRFSGLEMLKGLGYETHEVMVSLPVFANSQDMAELSAMLPDMLDLRVPGFILQGHGVYAWGKTPFEAFRHVEIWHYLFEYRWQELLFQRAGQG